MTMAVFHCCFLGGGLHLRNSGVTTSLINANIPLLSRRLKGERPVKVLLFPLRDSGRERRLTGGLTESGQYHDGRSFPLWTLKACFLPLIAPKDVGHPVLNGYWLVIGKGYMVACSFRFPVHLDFQKYTNKFGYTVWEIKGKCREGDVMQTAVTVTV